MTDAALRATALPVGRRRVVGGTGVGLALAVATVTTGAAEAQAADYTVEPGDTVSHIALRTSSSVKAIVKANGLDRQARIRAGQRLVIPSKDAPAKASSGSKKAATKTSAGTHKVVRGDTVSALAKRYGTTVSAIARANSLNSAALIRIGQVLDIPGSGGSTSKAGSAKSTSTSSKSTSSTSSVTHTVVSGDTVSALATRYGTTVRQIISANSLNSAALIRVGEKLRIPGSSSGSSTSSATKSTGVQLVGNTFAGRTYPDATVSSANQNKATLLEMGVPSRAEMQSLVASTARKMGVDPALAQAVAYQESGFNHASVSPANAIGTMQVIPSSGEWASNLVGRDLNLLDPRDNVTAGVAILRRLVATSPDLSNAIAGYYQGQAGVRKYGMYPDTRRYVANVQTLMSRFA